MADMTWGLAAETLADIAGPFGRFFALAYDNKEFGLGEQPWPLPLFQSTTRAQRAPRWQDETPASLGLALGSAALSWLALGCPASAAELAAHAAGAAGTAPAAKDAGTGHAGAHGRPRGGARSRPPAMTRDGPGREGEALPLQNDRKEAALARMAARVATFNAAGAIDAEKMGRTAAKVESLEAVLDHLESHGADRPGVRSGDLRFGQPPWEDDTEVLGHSSASVEHLAKDVDANRLSFGPPPQFDPAPFLDEETREVYKHPIQSADLGKLAEADVPRVRVRAGASGKIAFLEKLDEVARLGLVDSREVPAGLGSGAFAIPKDLRKDRLIMDSRPFNCVEETQSRWLSSLGAASCLCGILLDDHEILLLSGEDLKDYFYAFTVSPERLRRNAFAMQVRPEQVQHLRSFEPWMSQCETLTPCLATMAMGDCQAVRWARRLTWRWFFAQVPLAWTRWWSYEGKCRAGPSCQVWCWTTSSPGRKWCERTGFAATENTRARTTSPAKSTKPTKTPSCPGTLTKVSNCRRRPAFGA